MRLGRPRVTSDVARDRCRELRQDYGLGRESAARAREGRSTDMNERPQETPSEGRSASEEPPKREDHWSETARPDRKAEIWCCEPSHSTGRIAVLTEHHLITDRHKWPWPPSTDIVTARCYRCQPIRTWHIHTQWLQDRTARRRRFVDIRTVGVSETMSQDLPTLDGETHSDRDVN